MQPKENAAVAVAGPLRSDPCGTTRHCQIGSKSSTPSRGVRHSGSRLVPVVAAVLCAPLWAQADFTLLLRDGSLLAARSLRGSGTQLEVETGGQKRRLPWNDLVAVAGVASSLPELPAVHLAGGDVVHGAVAGGDSAGDRLDLQSPVLGLVPIMVDRLEALAAPGVTAPSILRLPDGVDEALFVRARVGVDIVAGTLHQFGDAGVRFQPDGADAPRWYGPADFVALRLRDSLPPPAPVATTLLTRTGDRLAVEVLGFGAEGVLCRLERGDQATVRFADLAGLAWHAGVVFASDLQPDVFEAGVDGDVVHRWQRDHNVLGGPLVSGGRSHVKGLGVHSRCRLVFVVPPGTERFRSLVGFDDGVAALPLVPEVEVRVLVDDRVAFRRERLSGSDGVLDTGLLTVKPGGTVTLEVEPGRGRDLGDRINWLSPVFLPAPARRP